MNQVEELKFWVHLLQMEVEALRSVLSEYGNGDDHSIHTQWIKAESISALKNSLRQV